jgi:cystathionine beta-lyase
MGQFMAKAKPDPNSLRPETRLVSAARKFCEHGIVNPPVYRASTILFPTVESLHDKSQTYVYGRRGTPTSRAFETAVAQLEGGHDAKASSSGLSAITTLLLGMLKSGDQLLMTDTVYAPVRHFCDTILKRLNIETVYYDPLIGGRIGALIQPHTRMVYTESPGSQTMEIQDIDAIAEEAKKRGCLVAMDNTWSSGLYFRPLEHGCDFSIQAATKYISGHSDTSLGVVTCNQAVWDEFAEAHGTLGQFAGPDDMYLALRGLRTLDIRLERHMRNALQVAEWLRERPEVEAVLYPALSNAPGHARWKRDFTGASGLFSVILKPCAPEGVARMLNGMTLFGMGYSWGGYESLVVPFKPHRTATTWNAQGACLRLHIGLENPSDLIDDLFNGFERLRSS